jgi:transcription elongation factor Elf1
MTILTSQHVHSRNWIKCPRCDGGALFTAKDRKQGAVCTSCGNRGEVQRHPVSKPVDNSSFYERQAGA